MSLICKTWHWPIIRFVNHEILYPNQPRISSVYGKTVNNGEVLTNPSYTKSLSSVQGHMFVNPTLDLTKRGQRSR